MRFIYVAEEDSGAFIFNADELEGMRQLLIAMFGEAEAEVAMCEFHKQRNRAFALKMLDEETIN